MRIFNKKIDSIKYEIEIFFSKLLNNFTLRDLPYWLAALVTGFTAVAYTLVFKYSEQQYKLIFEKNPYLILLISPLCFLFSWWLVDRFSKESKGSGIPQVMAAIEIQSVESSHSLIHRLLNFRVVLIKIISSTLCVLGGGAIGREGPTIQIGASIFHIIGIKTEKYTKHIKHQFWIITGSAAGIAAAFNTPLGGLVFAIEELTTDHLNKFKTSLIAAVIISGLASQWITGSYLYLGFPKLNNTGLTTVPWSIVIGLIAGLGGAIFGKFLFFLNVQKQKVKSKYIPYLAIICGLFIALLTIYFDNRTFGSGKESISQLLFSENLYADWKLVIVRFLSPLITYFSGCAGGIFAPSLAAGASIGSYISNTFSIGNNNLYTLLGMIAFLTGVTRAPFTSFVLVLEMTDRHSAIFSMMLTALTSSIISKTIDSSSIYVHLKKQFLPTNFNK